MCQNIWRKARSPSISLSRAILQVATQPLSPHSLVFSVKTDMNLVIHQLSYKTEN